MLPPKSAKLELGMRTWPFSYRGNQNDSARSIGRRWSRRILTFLQLFFPRWPAPPCRLKSRAQIRPRLEQLEARTVLNAGPVISELLAMNQRNLQDYDDDWSDWIELLNPTPEQIDLAGYYLTDDAGDPQKWQIPVETRLDPGERLVVFASGKDFVAPNGELHTNFKLAGGGEHLALIEPDGHSVAWQFDSALAGGEVGFPRQLEDISYGIELKDVPVPLVSSDGDIQYLVPSSAAQLHPDWNQPGFTDPDRVWSVSSSGNGVGFDTGDAESSLDDLLGYWPLDDLQENTTPDASGNGRDGEVIGATLQPAGGLDGGALSFDGDVSRVILGADTTTLNSTSALTVSGWFNLASDRTGFFGGTHVIISKGSTDAPFFIMAVNDQHLTVIVPEDGGSALVVEDSSTVSAADGWVHFALTASTSDGDRPGEIRLYRQGELAGTAAYQAASFPDVSQPVVLGQTANVLPNSGLHGLLDEVVIWDQVLSDGDIALLASGAMPVELSALPNEDFSSLMVTDLQDVMHGQNASAFIRAEFEVSDPRVIEELALRVRYDDGFLAHLNGTEVARHGAPASPVWNSTATTRHQDNYAILFEQIDLTGVKSLLRLGTNVLAIQGLNLESGNADFLLQVELIGTQRVVDPSLVRYFPEPTPGAENSHGAPTVASAPKFSAPAGMFTEEFLLELSTDVPGGVIHYTTDDSVPNVDSNIYDPESPIPITTITQVRAIVIASGYVTSPVVSQTYLKRARDLNDFSSQLPLVVLHNFADVQFNDFIKHAYWSIFEPDAAGGFSSLSSVPTLQTRAGVKVRGSSSGGFPKRSYSVEAWDEKDQDKRVSPLGLPGDSDWILSARYSRDRALMRNDFMYELSNQSGRYAVRTRFVEVFVNGDDGEVTRSDYVGVYSLMEKIKRGPDRVDVEKLSKNYDTEPLITGGYMVKIDRVDPGDRGFQAGGQRNLAYVDPKESEIEEPIREAQREFIAGYINQVADSLTNPDPQTGYPSWIDVDSWIDHHLLNVLAKSEDGLEYSTYLFKRRDGKLEFGPIWDFDLTMGNDREDDFPIQACCPEGWEPLNHNLFSYIWWGTLFEDPEFRQKYVDRYRELRKGAWSNENINAIISSLAAGVTVEAAERNFNRWSRYRPNSGDPPSWLGEVEHLRQWLIDRVEWIDSQLIPQPIMTPNLSGQSVVISDLPPGSLAFDFGPADSPVANGYVQVGNDVFDNHVGYSWTIGTPDVADRDGPDVLRRDRVTITGPSIFSVNLGNGTYEVTALMGDTDRVRDQMQLRFEPGTTAEVRDAITVTPEWYHNKTYTVEVKDGQLNLEISDLGGVSQQAVINGLVITPSGASDAAITSAASITLSLPEEAPEGTKLFYTLDGTDPRISSFSFSPIEDITTARDFHATADGTFAVDVANGRYEVTVRQGDRLVDRDQMALFLDEVLVDTVSTAARGFVNNTYHTEVTDGQLTLRIIDQGGASHDSVLNSLVVTPVEPSDRLAFDFGPADSPVAEGFVRVGNAGFNGELGYGWTRAANEINLVDRAKPDNLRRDLAAIPNPSESFAVNLENNTYGVTVVMGDKQRVRDEMQLRLEPGEAT